jgi:homoserine kinase type II
LNRKYLPEAVIALRFAWLYVWLRKKDREMVDLEIQYLRLIKDNIADLRYSWGSENY